MAAAEGGVARALRARNAGKVRAEVRSGCARALRGRRGSSRWRVSAATDLSLCSPFHLLVFNVSALLVVSLAVRSLFFLDRPGRVLVLLSADAAAAAAEADCWELESVAPLSAALGAGGGGSGGASASPFSTGSSTSSSSASSPAPSPQQLHQQLHPHAHAHAHAQGGWEAFDSSRRPHHHQQQQRQQQDPPQRRTLPQPQHRGRAWAEVRGQAQ